MAVAFQGNAFQDDAFQVSIVVSTLNMPLPINCVLIGEQLYERTGRTFERVPGRSGIRVRASFGATHQLGESPSFTVKSNAKGYD